MSKKFLSEFTRLTGEPFTWIGEAESPAAPAAPPSGVAQMPASPTGGQPDLTPMKNKAKEAMVAINDAFKAAEQGMADEAKQALQRAKAAIDQAMGGIMPSGTTGGKA